MYHQVARQFSYIEEDLGVRNLVAWWDFFIDDLFPTIEREMQRWANEAIIAAAAPYERAYNSGRPLRTYARVISALAQMRRQIPNLRFPPGDSMNIPKPGNGFKFLRSTFSDLDDIGMGNSTLPVY